MTGALTMAAPATMPATEKEYRHQIGHRARLARVDLGLSQYEVAVKAELTRNFVSAIERDAQGLDVWRLRRLAAGLGVPLAWMLGLTEAEMRGAVHV